MMRRRLLSGVAVALLAVALSGCTVTVVLPPVPKVRFLHIEQHDLGHEVLLVAYVKNHTAKPQTFYVEFWGEFGGDHVLIAKTEPKVVMPGGVLRVETSYSKHDFMRYATLASLWVEWAPNGHVRSDLRDL